MLAPLLPAKAQLRMCSLRIHTYLCAPASPPPHFLQRWPFRNDLVRALKITQRATLIL